MVSEVISLYKIAGGEHAFYPFSIQDYQRYVFGDDKRAHQFGTDLAKAFIATKTINQSFTNSVAVAVLSGSIPTATHSLREHFVAYLNRYLISLPTRPAIKINIYHMDKDVGVRTVPNDKSMDTYHIDGMRLGERSLVVLADVRMTKDWEDDIVRSLRVEKIDNPIIFSYIAALDGRPQTTSLSPLMSSVVSPTVKDIEAIAQAGGFTMNKSFVHFILGRDYAVFCSFVRRQNDCLVRRILDYAIVGLYYQDDEYGQNFEFLRWEVEARESV
ncbi:hypothetical protein NX059_010697 [Plenodomus lindquistii]|nr:hypothetical protein NX059_010697 [Plenodomus lindquistii]